MLLLALSRSKANYELALNLAIYIHGTFSYSDDIRVWLSRVRFLSYLLGFAFVVGRIQRALSYPLGLWFLFVFNEHYTSKLYPIDIRVNHNSKIFLNQPEKKYVGDKLGREPDRKLLAAGTPFWDRPPAE